MTETTLRLPGFVNAHSHAFQRMLRGRVEHVDPAHPRDDFWTWRDEMYRAANSIDPDGAYEIALLLYHEMVAAGYTAVGEFHYPHHRPGGAPYDDPNAMAKATVAAARDAGIEIVLLMCASARAGAGKPPTEGQARFCDPDVATYLTRVEALAGECRVGLAPHSVRAVPRQ
jgi:formimidoylglutamate deiminase